MWTSMPRTQRHIAIAATSNRTTSATILMTRMTTFRIVAQEEGFFIQQDQH
jgi:hypothetical protein